VETTRPEVGKGAIHSADGRRTKRGGDGRWKKRGGPSSFASISEGTGLGRRGGFTLSWHAGDRKESASETAAN